MLQLPLFKILSISLLGASLISPPFLSANAQAVSNHKKTVKIKPHGIPAKKSQKVAIKNKNRAKKNRAVSERDLWLKRAKSSQTLIGNASWYGKDFHNKATASGLSYDMYTFTAAHRTLPMGTIVKVTDQHNGKSVMVCVTDRGPFVHGRIIDLSYAAARQLGLNKKGVGKVALEVVSDENGIPLNRDKAYYIKYHGGAGKKIVGPFDVFADAAAMQEALSQAHPEAEVILDKTTR